MAKLKSSLLNMVLVLTIISAFMSFALGFVYLQTKGPIEEAKNQKVLSAISSVVPEYDNDPKKDMYQVDGLDFYPAKKNNELVGIAVKTFTNNGFNGYIALMVGFLPDGTINSISVLEHKETPGLGTKMNEPFFINQFNQKNPNNYKLTVKNDGGEVDAITAATISSRAFCEAATTAHTAFMKGEKNNE
jgi:Na+-translocating ferredoxin:NAD+ oxidoreductase subunit G